MKKIFLCSLFTAAGFASFAQKAIPVSDHSTTIEQTELFVPCTGEYIPLTVVEDFSAHGAINKNLITYTNAIQLRYEGNGYWGHMTYNTAVNARFVAGVSSLIMHGNGFLFGPGGRKYRLHWKMSVKTTADGTMVHQLGTDDLECVN